jgi:hypothetical protein
MRLCESNLVHGLPKQKWIANLIGARMTGENWFIFPANKPSDSDRVALRILETKGDISYGIGWWNGDEEKFVITASEEGASTLVFAIVGQH